MKSIFSYISYLAGLIYFREKKVKFLIPNINIKFVNFDLNIIFDLLVYYN